MKKLLFYSMLLLSFTACKLRKPPVVAPKEELRTDIQAIQKAVTESMVEFEYMSFKGTGPFEGFDMKQNITLNVRMKRHEVVWISLQAMLGIEVGRALITTDSVFLIQNLPDRAYYSYSLDSLSTLVGVNLTVTQLQDFLVGNPILPYDHARAELQGDSIVVEKQSGTFLLREFLVANLPKIVKNHLVSVGQPGEAEANYAAFQTINTKTVPSKVNIFVNQSGNRARLDLNYSHVSFEPITQFPFRKQAN